MAGAEDAREADFEEASTKLNEGLETCRVVVETYRELLVGEPIERDGCGIPAAANDDEPRGG